MILFLMIATPILILFIGYLTWNSAMENYGYNIFNTWVLIRLLIAILLGILIDPSIGLIMFVIFSIWNFIVSILTFYERVRLGKGTVCFGAG